MVKRYIGGIISATPPTVTANSTGVFAGIASAIQYVQTAAFPSRAFAPTNISASAGENQATITVTAPTNTGRLPILYYIVRSTPGNITATGTSSPITITGLTNNTSYTFTVTAVTSLGDGDISAPSNSVTPLQQRTLEYLVVAGGGGGGGVRGGGGGAGGLLAGSTNFSSGSTLTISLGGGGAGAAGNPSAPSNNGSAGSSTSVSGPPSVFPTGSTLTVFGGGYGAGFTENGGPGGSGGGGGGNNPTLGGSGTPGQGFAGGRCTVPGTNSGGGGGGGAAQAGADTVSLSQAGPGGSGYLWLNGGYYAGGGGGGEYQSGVAGSGGVGGGGAGGTQGSPSTAEVAGTPGSANTGGGGGGGSGNGGDGGSGGSGVAIFRYPGSQVMSGGSVSSGGGYTYHTFTTSGSLTYN